MTDKSEDAVGTWEEVLTVLAWNPDNEGPRYLTVDEIRAAVKRAQDEARDRGMTPLRALRHERAVVRAVNKERRRQLKFARSEARIKNRVRRRPPVAVLGDAVAPAVARATSVDEEIFGLLSGIPDRARAMSLEFWGYSAWPPTTLEALGAKHGVTRERVRQITTLHDERLKQLALEGIVDLPLARRSIAVLDQHGGAMTLGEWSTACAESGVATSAEALRSLEKLGCWVYPLVRYSPEVDLWCTEERYDFLYSGPRAGIVSEIRRVARRGLRRVGAIQIARLRRVAPELPVELIARLVISGRSRVVKGYLVPLERKVSWKRHVGFRLARGVVAMLVVTPELTIGDVARGLARMGRLALRPPLPVLRAVVDSCSLFQVESDRVRLSEEIPRRAVLHKASIDVVEAMEARGGMMSWRSIHAVLVARGHGSNWLRHLFYAPFLVRVEKGVFALRGQHRIQGSEAEPRNDSPQQRDFVLVRPPWAEDDEATIRYRITPAVLGGTMVLPLWARHLTASTEGEWRGVDDAGASYPLQLREGMIWDVGAWFRSVGAIRGAQFTMCLNITERVARLQYYAPESVELHDETVASAVAAVRQQRGQRRALRHLLLIETRDEQSLEAAQQLRRTRRRLKRSTELTLPSDLRENLDSLVRRRLRFYQPATDDAEDRLLVELVDFPLAPELSGVFMGVLCKPVSRRRSQSAQLFERRMMEEAREIDVTAALALIPSLGYLVRRARSSLAWREYAPGRSAWPVVRSATTVADNGEPDNSA